MSPRPKPPKKGLRALGWTAVSIAGVLVLFLAIGVIGAMASGGMSKAADVSPTPAPTVTVTVPGPERTVTVTAPAAAPTPAPTVTVTKTVTATVTAPAPAAAPPAAPAAGGVIYQKSGSGMMTTPNFTTPDEWQVQWTYDCSNFGMSGNFIVDSEDSQATVNELGAKGADTTYVHGDPGQHSLKISSECSWTVKVVG
jgi:hypothetical protein